MADLTTFDDRTIQRAREKFTGGTRGSGDDPIATHSKVAQDVMLGHLYALVARAEEKAYATHAGLQDETVAEDLIDPFLSYDENVARIEDELGVSFRTYAEAGRDAELADADAKARRHARQKLRAEREAIEAGERAELVRDIADEFGQDFVADVLGRERGPEPAPATLADARASECPIFSGGRDRASIPDYSDESAVSAVLTALSAEVAEIRESTAHSLRVIRLAAREIVHETDVIA